MITPALVFILFLAGCSVQAQVSRPSTSSEPTMKHPLIPSHGQNLLGVFYLAGGTVPHPTAILFHGFPGYEQNLDIAQALRRSGWNVLAMHYRGSWGVAGDFSFLHAAEDADAQVEFVLDAGNIAKFHIDPQRIVVIGHSMGGFMAASAAAHNPKVKAAILLSAWNIGAARSSEKNEADALADNDNLAPISGTTGVALAHEEFTHRNELDLNRLATSIAPRPVLIVTASDGSDQFAAPFAGLLKSAGDSRVVIQHFGTDHHFSNERLELADAVLTFLNNQ